SYNNVAFNLNAQENYVVAEPLFRKALAIWLKTLGEGHPQTAFGYNNVAFNLDAQGKYAAAEPLFHTTLAIRLKTLGGDHPHTARSYNLLANNLNAQGRLDDAVTNWTAAAAISERTRGSRSASGLERSLIADSSPLPALAITLARQGKHRDAWASWESDL